MPATDGCIRSRSRGLMTSRASPALRPAVPLALHVTRRSSVYDHPQLFLNLSHSHEAGAGTYLCGKAGLSTGLSAW